MDNQHLKEKLHFQIERIAFFSDAVIAIAVTLLIIEIKAPKILSGSSLQEQVQQLKHLIPEFISFIISFSIIVAQWIKHHKLFGNVVNYDNRLIVLNSSFLLVIALIPFSTSYFALNNIGAFYLPYLVYGLSLFALTFLNFLLFNHITHPQRDLYDGSMSPGQLRLQKVEYLLFPMVLLVTITFGYFSLKLALFVYVILLQVGYYMIRKKKKKLRLQAAELEIKNSW